MAKQQLELVKSFERVLKLPRREKRKWAQEGGRKRGKELIFKQVVSGLDDSHYSESSRNDGA